VPLIPKQPTEDKNVMQNFSLQSAPAPKSLARCFASSLLIYVYNSL